MSRMAVAIFIAGASLGCGRSATPEIATESTRVQVAKSGSPVITHLERRNMIVTIHAGDEGPLYSVTTKDGAPVDTLLNVEQLRAKHRDLHDALQSDLAGERIIDASVRRSAE